MNHNNECSEYSSKNCTKNNIINKVIKNILNNKTNLNKKNSNTFCLKDHNEISDEYKFEKVIGEGSYSIVVKATHILSNYKV